MNYEKAKVTIDLDEYTELLEIKNRVAEDPDGEIKLHKEAIAFLINSPSVSAAIDKMHATGIHFNRTGPDGQYADRVTSNNFSLTRK